MVLLAMAVIVALPVFRRSYSRLSIRACFSDVKGLREGAEVRFGGVDIGRVRIVRAQPDKKECPADVEMAIGPGYELKIPSDSTVVVETAGVLGAAFLDIDARTASGPPIANHGVLSGRSVPALSTEEMIKMFAKVLDHCPGKEDRKQNLEKDPRVP